MSKPLILCIDDEEVGLRIRRMVLERAGYRVLTATDGRAGVGLFSDESVQAVVLDYFMPRMNGGDVAKEMRSLRPDVPIILLSAYINLPAEVVSMVDCTILKGEGPERLLAKLRDLLPEQESTPAPETLV